MSRPVQVYLDDAEARRLEGWARERGWTKSQAVRAAIRALTGAAGDDPILELSGMFHGLPPDAAARFDRYLMETYVAEPSSRYGSRRRPPVRRQRGMDRRRVR